jgi:hypothetical protein
MSFEKKETKDDDEYLDPVRQILLFSSLAQPTLLMKQSYKQRQQEKQFSWFC